MTAKRPSRSVLYAPQLPTMLFVWAFCTGTPMAAEDNYLKAIQSEVRGLDDPGTIPDPPAQPGKPGQLPPYLESPRPAPPAPPPPPRMPGYVQPDGEQASQQQFETSLRASYPGSFFLLRKLPPEEQQAILEEYQQTGDLFRIRQMIVELARRY